MGKIAIHEHLRQLEVSLHTIEVRSNRAELDRLLHDDFTEFGRSGRIYNKQDVLAEFQDSTESFIVTSRDFNFVSLSESVVLLTYQSAHVVNESSENRLSLRSSIWQKTGPHWKLRFHQGTPVE